MFSPQIKCNLEFLLHNFTSNVLGNSQMKNVVYFFSMVNSTFVTHVVSHNVRDKSWWILLISNLPFTIPFTTAYFFIFWFGKIVNKIKGNAYNPSYFWDPNDGDIKRNRFKLRAKWGGLLRYEIMLWMCVILGKCQMKMYIFLYI